MRNEGIGFSRVSLGRFSNLLTRRAKSTRPCNYLTAYVCTYTHTYVRIYKSARTYVVLTYLHACIAITMPDYVEKTCCAHISFGSTYKNQAFRTSHFIWKQTSTVNQRRYILNPIDSHHTINQRASLALTLRAGLVSHLYKQL